QPGFKNLPGAAAQIAGLTATATEDERRRYGPERQHLSHLLRCILGNPFRPVALNATWLAWSKGLVHRLASTAYEERSMPDGALDMACLAVLGDALEEAGCNEEQILSHCRGPGPHARGCWVVDLLLRKK